MNYNALTSCTFIGSFILLLLETPESHPQRIEQDVSVKYTALSNLVFDYKKYPTNWHSLTHETCL